MATSSLRYPCFACCPATTPRCWRSRLLGPALTRIGLGHVNHGLLFNEIASTCQQLHDTFDDLIEQKLQLFGGRRAYGMEYRRAPRLFFNSRSAKKRLGWSSRKKVEDVTQDLGVKPETVLEMEARLNNYDVPFDGFDPEDDERPAAPAPYLADRRLEPFAELEREDTETNERDQLYTALNGLYERSKAILEARWLSEKTATLHELA